MSKAKRTPTIEAMYLAAEWLDCNEGGDGEAEACHAVAEWLRAQASAKTFRACCRLAGLPVGKARKALGL